MPRDPKIEVSAVNIRIPESHDRDYVGLIKALADLRRGVRVFGESYVAINFFDDAELAGVISKYTEIDINGEWFDLDDFEVAAPEKLEEINIPENLRPNLSQFYFLLDPDLHLVAYTSYSESRGLSTRSIEKYFREAVLWPEIQERFGRVEVDVIKDYGAVDAILALPDLKELHLLISRPNSDDVGRSLADIIEERLREQQADQYEETLKSNGAKSLRPNERTHQLALVAAENGQVRARSLVNGVLTDQSTAESPLTEVRTYKPDEAELPIFQSMARAIFDRVKAFRERLAGRETSESPE